MVKNTEWEIHEDMSYSAFRNQFDDAEEFRRAYGSLNYEQAKGLIDREGGNVTVKAAMITVWTGAHEKYGNKEHIEVEK